MSNVAICAVKTPAPNSLGGIFRPTQLVVLTTQYHRPDSFSAGFRRTQEHWLPRTLHVLGSQCVAWFFNPSPRL